MSATSDTIGPGESIAYHLIAIAAYLFLIGFGIYTIHAMLSGSASLLQTFGHLGLLLAGHFVMERAHRKIPKLTASS